MVACGNSLNLELSFTWKEEVNKLMDVLESSSGKCNDQCNELLALHCRDSSETTFKHAPMIEWEDGPRAGGLI